MKLIRPSADLREEILGFKEEFLACGESTISGSELLDKIDSFDEWLAYVNANASDETLLEDCVLTDTYLALVDSTVVGIICLRHSLNEYLRDFGHIGYSVRPTQRKKGIATRMLEEVLKIAKNSGMGRVYLSAEHDNIASRRTILKNNGNYISSFIYVGMDVDRYEIIL